MLSRKIYIIAIFSVLLLQSCSKKDPVLIEAPILYHNDGDVSKVMFSRPDGVNIVILGDGFTKEDLKKNGNYDARVKEITDFLFSVEPFKQYSNCFNIYQVYAESKVSGAADVYTPERTKFESYFGTGNGRDLLPGNYDICYRYAAKAVPVSGISLLVMLVNDIRYAGTGGAIATVSTNEWAKYTLLHEAGHTFAGLADEYVEEITAPYFSLESLPFLPNVDNTSELTKIKWAHLLESKGYRPQLGAFEGGYYRQNGIFRPEENSIMRSINYAHFNAPSREAIVRTIKARMGISFDLGLFLKEDAKNLLAGQPKTTLQIPPLHHDFIGMKQRTVELHKLRSSIKPLN